ncbi:hypothetical protein ACF0H5_001275 [Mactra antiquata]
MNAHTLDRLLDKIIDLDSSVENDLHLILCGDMNARTSESPDFVINDNFAHIDSLPDDYVNDVFLTRSSLDKGHLNSNGRMLLDFCKQTGLRILNGRVDGDKTGNYTFVGSNGSSVVDYVICTRNLFPHVETFNINDPNILSDHCLISFAYIFYKIEECNLQIDKNNYEFVNCKYVWDSNKKHDFIERLSSNEIVNSLNLLSTDIDNVQFENDIDTCISEMSNILDKAASPFFKRNVTHSCRSDTYSDTRRENKWFTNECYEKRCLFYNTLNTYRKNKTETNRINMCRARSQYKNIIRHCKFTFDKEQTTKLSNARHKNAKLYWSMLKQCAGVSKSNISLSVFEQYFKSVNNPDSQFFTPDEDIVNFIDRYEQNEYNIMFEELNMTISLLEVQKAIKELKTNKSSGPDLILNEFFIHGNYILAPYLLKLMNKVFETEYFPQSWSEGYVIPLHKKGSISNENNYRGITLLSTLGKLFTKILNNRLIGWAENYSVYIEAQAGFRTKMGTTDNIFVLHGLITHMLNEGKQLYCAFIDFTKAFDYVVRDNLWSKLIKLGVRGKILNIIKSMYQSVKSRVKYCNQLSDSYTCALGVRQGECLSPFLFSMFLNDIENIYIVKGLSGIDIDTIKIFLILYADDIVLFANNSVELQTCLDSLYDYCQRWKLVVNTTKTKIMIFRKGGRLSSNINFFFNGKTIEIVNKFNYLGIVFSTSGSFSSAQETISGQAMKAIFKMNKYLCKFTNISVSHKIELFDKLITPILNYSSEVWGFVHGMSIERVHLQFCKTILGVKRSTQNDFIYGELGRINYQCTRHFNIIKYWVKLLQTSDTKFKKIVYLCLKSDSEKYPNKVNWCTLLKQLLSTLGFYEVWLFQDIGHTDIFLNNVKVRLRDLFIQGWHGRIGESSRASFYKHFSSFKFQPYLDICQIPKFRYQLTRLRVSSHSLYVESGRWVKPNPIPFNERICSACNKLEDEYHFILECSLYNDIRDRYIPRYYINRPSMFKFITLITNENPKVIKMLSTFILKAFNYRSNYNIRF